VNPISRFYSGAVTASESMSIGPGRTSRVAPDGSKLLWSTDTGKQSRGIDRLPLTQDSSRDAVRGIRAAASRSAQKLSSAGTLLSNVDLGSPSPDGICEVTLCYDRGFRSL
jgi:hypothetical protein